MYGEGTIIFLYFSIIHIKTQNTNMNYGYDKILVYNVEYVLDN